MTQTPDRIWIEDERPIGGDCYIYSEPTEGVLLYAEPYLFATPAREAADDTLAALEGLIATYDDARDPVAAHNARAAIAKAKGGVA